MLTVALILLHMNVFNCHLVIQLYFVFSNRSNLDPFKLYSEEQIWDALERTHMKECVSQTHTTTYIAFTGKVLTGYQLFYIAAAHFV